MSKNYAFKAMKRDRAGKGVARALRREGKVPAVIYGDNKDPIGIALPANDINVEYVKGHMFTNLCNMDVDGEKHLVLARDIQLHPVTDRVIHADFLRVTPKTQIAVFVPVHFTNQEISPGLKAGGTLAVVRFEVELFCSAMDIPEYIEVDMSKKKVGESIKINDAVLPAGAKPVIERNFVLANIAAPKTEAQEAAEDAAGAAEAKTEVEGDDAEKAEGENE